MISSPGLKQLKKPKDKASEPPVVTIISLWFTSILTDS